MAILHTRLGKHILTLLLIFSCMSILVSCKSRKPKRAKNTPTASTTTTTSTAKQTDAIAQEAVKAMLASQQTDTTSTETPSPKDAMAYIDRQIAEEKDNDTERRIRDLELDARYARQKATPTPPTTSTVRHVYETTVTENLNICLDSSESLNSALGVLSANAKTVAQPTATP